MAGHQRDLVSATILRRIGFIGLFCILTCTLFGQASGHKTVDVRKPQTPNILPRFPRAAPKGALISSSSAAGQFFEAPTYATDCCPTSIAIADINGDGKLDLITANSGGTASVLLGNGDGTFQGHLDSETGPYPLSVVVADFNRDGKLDLATVNYNNATVSVLLGNGNGTFQPHRDYAITEYSSSLVAGDFNGDGIPDLAATSYEGGSLLLGNGDGSFQVYRAFDSGFGCGLASADLNGDGKLDLATASCADYTSVIFGNGDGTFQPPVNYHIAYAGYADFVAIADLNGDGKPDLALPDGNDTPTDADQNCVHLVMNDGLGGFNNTGCAWTGDHTRPGGLASGDFDGDGRVDLVTANTGNNVSVLFGSGDGNFGWNGYYYGTGGSAAVGVADLNGDGKLDLAVASGGGVSVLLNNGNGTFQARRDFVTKHINSGVVVGDFNKDGKPDLAAADYDSESGDVTILLGQGDGTYQITNAYWANYPLAISEGDLNGDGTLDLVTASPDSDVVSVLLGKGDGSFYGRTEYRTASTPESVAVGDFNGDGKPDLAAACIDAVSVLLGNGDGSFQGHVDYAAGSNARSIAVGDFNGDNKLDLAVADNAGVSILLGNGDGTFQLPLELPAGGNSRSVAVWDFNGDGILDLAIADDAGVSILLGYGDGTFQPAVAYAAGDYAKFVSVGDFNRDGKPDLAVANYGDGSVSVLSGNGDGTFQTHVEYATGIRPAGIGVGDFNKDTNLDLAVVNETSGTVSILSNTAGTADIPVVTLSTYSLSFPTQLVGTSSRPQPVLLTNTGGVELDITSISASGDFTRTDTCGSRVRPGSGCSITVTFSPTDINTRNGTIVLRDNAGDNPQTMWLTGLATVVQLSPTKVDFGRVRVGETSQPQTVTLTNRGQRTLAIAHSGIQQGSEFTQTNTCTGSLGAGRSCRFSVSFAPKTIGIRTGALAVIDDGGASPQRVRLGGTGVR